jgi:hypothetical protein
VEINEFFYRDMTYREALLETSLSLKYFIHSLQNNIFEITMTGEMKEWSAAVPTGEEHQIPMEVFEACDDINVSGFLKLLKVVDSKYESFLNINNIREEEIHEFENMKYDEHYEEEEGKQDDDEALPF